MEEISRVIGAGTPPHVAFAGFAQPSQEDVPDRERRSRGDGLDLIRNVAFMLKDSDDAVRFRNTAIHEKGEEATRAAKWLVKKKCYNDLLVVLRDATDSDAKEVAHQALGAVLENHAMEPIQAEKITRLVETAKKEGPDAVDAVRDLIAHGRNLEVLDVLRDGIDKEAKSIAHSLLHKSLEDLGLVPEG